ncbi:hypothetical protein [Streptomyces abikoensis]|uniref:hypothetical protein n=1 Tax=Streptomyces abikoensis TaxID=97398 RepID=UPI001E5CAECF|nr:hypothetical protein [Streptomyces abikoensis]
MPLAPPGAANLPPWRTAAPVPPPPPAPPPVPPMGWAPPPAAPVEVRVVVDFDAPEPEPEAEQRDFGWLWKWLRPWRTAIATAVVVIPFPAYGHSFTSAWAATLHDARAESLSAAYLVALAAAGGAFLVDLRRPAWWTRPALVIAVIGGTGALGWYDPVTLITGVRP